MGINGDLLSGKLYKKTMENHNFSWVYQLEMTIFNSYVKLPGGTDDLRMIYGGKNMSFQFDS